MPFAICDGTPDGIALARHTGARVTYGWDGPGMLMEQVSIGALVRRGRPALSVECGQHEDPDTTKRAWGGPTRFLGALGITDHPTADEQVGAPCGIHATMQLALAFSLLLAIPLAACTAGSGGGFGPDGGGAGGSGAGGSGTGGSGTGDSGAAQDPYGDVGSFCEQWGKAACNSTVVTSCSASSADACIASQKAYCLSLVAPSGYSSKYAKQCIQAVHDAYADATITAAEYAIVTKLAAPCDRLEAGPGASGATCTSDSDCNTLDGLHCVMVAGASSGACYVPKVQDGGFPCNQPDETCATGFYCDGSTCIARMAAGDACSTAQPCVETALCVNGTCQAKATTGASCAQDADCTSDICTTTPTGGVCGDSIILSTTEPLCSHLR